MSFQSPVKVLLKGTIKEEDYNKLISLLDGFTCKKV